MVSFGITPQQAGVSFEHIKDVATKSEQLGYSSLWFNDHFYTYPFFYPIPKSNEPYFECWTTLTSIACITKKMRIGTLCLSTPYRHPSLVAKMSSCLDVISGGRLELGLGAGWFGGESIAYGIPFEKPAKRVGMLRESIQIIKKMWAQEEDGVSKSPPSFDGDYFSITKAYNYPKPIQKPHPPLWVGATGEKRMLRVVAEFADGWNIQTPITPKEYRSKLDCLKQHCKQVGRSVESIRRSIWAGALVAKDHKQLSKTLENFKPPNTTTEKYLGSRIAGTPEECVERIKEFEKLGVESIILYFLVDELESMKLFAEEVISRF